MKIDTTPVLPLREHAKEETVQLHNFSPHYKVLHRLHRPKTMKIDTTPVLPLREHAKEETVQLHNFSPHYKILHRLHRPKTMKIDTTPVLPLREHAKEETVPFIDIPSQIRNDDVSVLSFDASHCSQPQLPRPLQAEKESRFLPTPSKSDMSPMCPVRRQGSLRSLNNPPVSPSASSLHGCQKSNATERSTDSAPTVLTTDSVVSQLENFLETVNNLGLQMSVLKGQYANQLHDFDVHNEIKLLRQQLEQERRLRENVQTKFEIEKDSNVAARAKQELEKVIIEMNRNMDLIRDHKETDKALKDLQNVVRQLSARQYEKSTCFTIPEFEPVTSSCDASTTSSSRKSSQSKSSSRKSSKSSRVV